MVAVGVGVGRRVRVGVGVGGVGVYLVVILGTYLDVAVGGIGVLDGSGVGVAVAVACTVRLGVGVCVEGPKATAGSVPLGSGIPPPRAPPNHRPATMRATRPSPAMAARTQGGRRRPVWGLASAASFFRAVACTFLRSG